jgi:hypothetical protein
MRTYIEFLATLPVLIICYQLYSYSAKSRGFDRQRRCQKLGIVFMTLGTTSLIAHRAAFVFAGLILIMMGFRLIAKGLDRLDKKVFIDRYDENNGEKPNEKDKGE